MKNLFLLVTLMTCLGISNAQNNAVKQADAITQQMQREQDRRDSNWSKRDPP